MASYNDQAKQLSRERLRDFIRKNLLCYRKPKNVRVVCFPGAEKEGEEAIEVKEVYDALGIPRKNIVGLEGDPEKAERLRRADLGIKVVNSFDVDFFEATDQKFDVVSLDYTGQQTDDKLRALGLMVGKGMIERFGVLCTNYAAQRESEFMQTELLHKYTRVAFQGDHHDRLGKLDARLNGVREIDLDETRDAITYEIIRILRLGDRNLEGLKILKEMSTAPKALRRIKAELAEMRETDEYKRHRRILARAGVFTEKEYDAWHTDPPENSDLWHHNLRKSHAVLMKYGLETIAGCEILDATASSISHLLMGEELKPYFPEKIERYSYRSNKNTSMYMDMLFINQHEREFNQLSDLVSIGYNPYRLIWDPLHYGFVKCLEKIRKIEQKIVAADKNSELPERTNLGSSFVPPKGRPGMPLNEALYLLEEGFTPREIASTYSGFSRKELEKLRK